MNKTKTDASKMVSVLLLATNLISHPGLDTCVIEKMTIAWQTTFVQLAFDDTQY